MIEQKAVRRARWTDRKKTFVKMKRRLGVAGRLCIDFALFELSGSNLQVLVRALSSDRPGN